MDLILQWIATHQSEVAGVLFGVIAWAVQYIATHWKAFPWPNACTGAVGKRVLAVCLALVGALVEWQLRGGQFWAAFVAALLASQTAFTWTKKIMPKAVDAGAQGK